LELRFFGVLIHTHGGNLTNLRRTIDEHLPPPFRFEEDRRNKVFLLPKSAIS
jgi:hypothetical protein